MTVSNIAKIALWVVVGLVALAVVKSILSTITSFWFIAGAFAIWWFGFRNKGD